MAADRLPIQRRALRYRAVLFDFDGTLAVLQIDFAEMKNRVHELTRRRAPDFVIDNSVWTLEHIAAVTAHLHREQGECARKFCEDAYAAVAEVELHAAGHSRWLPGAQEAVQWLRQQNLRVGVVTRNCRRAIEQVAGPSVEWCDALFTRDEVTRVKPDPEHLRTALRALEVEPREALMVGDHATDVLVAHAAGLDGVGVLTGNASRTAFVAAGARHVLNSVAGLPSWLVNGDG